MSKIEIKRDHSSRLVWINPSVDHRASSHLFQDDTPTRKGVESVMEKFLQVTEAALWGNYDYPDKLAHIEKMLERLHIDLLNFDRIKSQQAAD